MSLWAATVITNLFGAIPLVGDAIVSLLWGGFSVDNPTLNRFFSFHYVLPFVIVAVVIMHIWALHIPGSNNPLGIDVKGPQDTVDFHPYHTVKDLFMMSVLAVVFFAFVFYAPNYMGHPDNYIPADAMVTPEHIVPEWYFLPFYAILRSVPDIGMFGFVFIEAKLAGVVAMAASLLLLFALPWLDRSPVRSGTFRPIMKLLFWVLVVNVIVLGIVGAKVPDDIAFSVGSIGISWLIVGQLTTAYYFAYFLVALPLLSKFEKTRPLPESISEPVLPRNAAA
jgi:quinol-cytochrome oxidoreductase complex cytochrome b subunit